MMTISCQASRSYCSQIPVLLNDDGSIFNEELKEKLAKERQQWK